MTTKKAIAIGVLASLSFAANADTNSDLTNQYIMTGVTLSGQQENTFQGINLEYNTIDYTSHWSEHKHMMGGYGLHINTDDSKFDDQFENVREIALYKKVGFELADESNIYGITSLGAGVYETSTPKDDKESANDSESSSGQSVKGADNHNLSEEENNTETGDDPQNEDPNNNNDSTNDDSSNNDYDVGTGNPNTNEEILLRGEVSAGVGYYSRDGKYSASVEAVGSYYESEGFEPWMRVMFGWRF